jgi:hypothetical protein
MGRGGRPITRRSFVIGGGLGLIAAPARASEFAYKDWRFDTDAIHGPLSDAVIQSFQAQIDIVESLNIKPDIKDFFRHVSVIVEPGTIGYDARYYARTYRRRLLPNIHRILLTTRIEQPDNPVLLNVLLAAYLDERVADRWRDGQMTDYLNDARRSGAFPNRSDMLRTPQAFFATCVGVVLWGHATREPFRRAKVREKLPAFYDWIVTEFYPAGVLPAGAF